MIAEKCCNCPEDRYNALREVEGVTICYCCSSYAKKRKSMFCHACKQIRPAEMHHIFGKSTPITIPICLNCHYVIHAEMRRYGGVMEKTHGEYLTEYEYEIGRTLFLQSAIGINPNTSFILGETISNE